MCRSGLNKIIRKIDRTGTSKRRPSRGRPRTTRTDDKIEEIETLVLSQEDFIFATDFALPLSPAPGYNCTYPSDPLPYVTAESFS